MGACLGNYLRELPACCEALAAIDGTVVLGSKGNLGCCATVGAYRLVHFTRGPGSGTAGLALLTASFATGGLVLETFFGVEFLLACGKHELSTTVFANQRFVFVHDLVTP